MIEQIFNYFTIEILYYWINLGVLPFWLILIFLPNSYLSKYFVTSIFPFALLTGAYIFMLYKTYLGSYDYLINFSVFKESKKIGVIENIITELPQPVFEVKMDSKKVMIPIHEDLIEKIDKKQKIIYIDIPDGLTEII